MKYFHNIFIFWLLNTYNDERNIDYSDFIEKELYFDSINYKDEGYIEIKTVKNTIESISIKI